MSTKRTLANTIMIPAITLPVWAQNSTPVLSLGDPAPDHDITIIKREPIDIGNDRGATIYEFWKNS